jgi:hypothetical protein
VNRALAAIVARYRDLVRTESRVSVEIVLIDTAAVDLL